MATKSISCDSVMTAQADELQKQGRQLMETSEALRLSQSNNGTLESILSNSKEQGRVDKMQYDLNEKVLRKKVRKRNLLILGESVVIVLLVSTLF